MAYQFFELLLRLKIDCQFAQDRNHPLVGQIINQLCLFVGKMFFIHAAQDFVIAFQVGSGDFQVIFVITFRHAAQPGFHQVFVPGSHIVKIGNQALQPDRAAFGIPIFIGQALRFSGGIGQRCRFKQVFTHVYILSDEINYKKTTVGKTAAVQTPSASDLI